MRLNVLFLLDATANTSGITNYAVRISLDAPLVPRTVVVHSGAVRQNAEARVKTHAEDIRHPLRLLIANVVLYLRIIVHPFAHAIMGLIVRAKRQETV